jgi:hypothetical protein
MMMTNVQNDDNVVQNFEYFDIELIEREVEKSVVVVVVQNEKYLMEVVEIVYGYVKVFVHFH